MVPSLQSFYDIRLYAVYCRFLEISGTERTIGNDETCHWVFSDGARLPRHGARGVERRRRQSELGLVAGVFRRYYGWRALPFTNKPVVGHQDCTGVPAIDDDGNLARYQFRGKLPRRLPR